MGQLDDLIALREDLQRWISEAAVDKKSPLVAQYRATVADIEKLTPKEAVGDAIDEIAARRNTRRASPAAGPGRTKREG